jgi:hypothetical protein
MILDDLTRDNIHLSRPKMADSAATFAIAIHGRTLVDEHVSSLVRDSLADSTRRAYLSDLAHFETWGGQVPATDELIASYLAAYAETSSTATLQRRVASLSKAHRALGVPNPTKSERDASQDHLCVLVGPGYLVSRANYDGAEAT